MKELVTTTDQSKNPVCCATHIQPRTQALVPEILLQVVPVLLVHHECDCEA